MRASLGIALLAAACVPDTYAYAELPVLPTDGRDHALAIIRVDLVQLAPRLEDFDAEALAFYGRGRTPLPYRLEDADGDGTADHATVKMPVPADGATLTVTCPGPRSPIPFPEGGAAVDLTVHY